jgi:uncharacterized protein with HEPN domain
MAYPAFSDSTLHLYAVVRCLEIISEASRRLPDDLKDRHPSIEWRDIAGDGSIHRHDYDDVTAVRVWRTLTVSLPLLRVVADQEFAERDLRA